MIAEANRELQEATRHWQQEDWTWILQAVQRQCSCWNRQVRQSPWCSYSRSILFKEAGLSCQWKYSTIDWEILRWGRSKEEGQRQKGHCCFSLGKCGKQLLLSQDLDTKVQLYPKSEMVEGQCWLELQWQLPGIIDNRAKWIGNGKKNYGQTRAKRRWCHVLSLVRHTHWSYGEQACQEMLTNRLISCVGYCTVGPSVSIDYCTVSACSGK